MARVSPVPFLLLAAAAFISATAARIIDPLLADLAGQFHTSIAGVSLLIAAFTLPYGLAQLFLGPLADRFGKLRVMAGAMLLLGLAMVACAFAASLTQLTLLRMATGAGAAGLLPLSLAFIGDALPYAQRQVAMSRITAGFTIGQMGAGPFSGILADTVGWRSVFFAVGLAALLLCVILAWRLRGIPEPAGQARFNLGRYRALFANPAARLLLGTCVFEGALFAGSFPFMAPFLRDGWHLSYSAVGLILAGFGAGGLGYSIAAPRLVPALSERALVLFGGLLIAAAFVLAVTAGSWHFFPIFEAMLGFGYFTAHGVLQARATELLPTARSTAVSLFALTLFLGQSLGAIGLGNAVSLAGFRIALTGVAIAVALLALWLAWLVRAPASRPRQA